MGKEKSQYNVNGVLKSGKELDLNDITILFQQFVDKNGHYPFAKECIIENNVPHSKILKRILDENNIVLTEWQTKFGKVGHVRCYKEHYDFYVKRFEEELHKASSTIEVIGKYKGYNEKILVHCKDCDTVYKTTPHILINGHKCKACAMKAVGEMKIKSTDTFITELRSISPNIEIIGEYVQSKEKVECLCKDCGNIWFAMPNNLLKGNNCPVCSVKKSKSEKKIQEILDKQGIVYESQKKYDDLFGVGNKLLSYDFYIPRYNILIEAQGQQHENPIEIFGGEKQFKIQQEHDRRKREYAEKNGYKLLEIWYYDYDRIEEILNRELEVV